MGRPRKDPSEKKSHAQIQSEYEERQKKIMGEKKYKAKRAKQRAESRARCWKRYTAAEKEAHRAKQRIRAYKFRHRQHFKSSAGAVLRGLGGGGLEPLQKIAQAPHNFWTKKLNENINI